MSSTTIDAGTPCATGLSPGPWGYSSQPRKSGSSTWWTRCAHASPLLASMSSNVPAASGGKSTRPMCPLPPLVGSCPPRR